MTRSLWGWGEVERLPPLEAVAARAAVLGELTPESPAAFDEARLAPPRVEVPAAIASFSTDGARARAAHARGKSYPDRLRGFRGDFGSAPDLVIAPRTAEEVTRALEACEAASLAVVPFGGGSSVVGGVEPALGPRHRGTASLDLAALGRVLEVDDTSRLARIEAGALGPALESQLAPHGLTLRCFPQSFEFSSLGGWIATRAGGHFATLHTRIDDLVHAVTMITPRGELVTPRVPSSGAGPDPKRLVLGSEGTLGVITEAWMRVQPRPRFRANATVAFERFDGAVAAAREIAQSGLYPSNCRLLDAQEAALNAVSFDGSTLLILAFESADHPLGAWIDRALALAKGHGGTCERGAQLRESARATDEQSEGWRKAFLEGPYLQDALICLGVIADTFETACTWTRFPALYGAVREATQAALDRVCGGGVVTCRFTHVYPDGPAPYFTFVGKARRGGELEQWAELKHAASDAVQKAGGTITHHHAVGRVHREGYQREAPPVFLEALRAAKARLDPKGMLNPGVLFDAR